MTNNLVSVISQIFGSQMVSRVATALGISPGMAQSLTNAAIPAVLGALGSLAATPAGADKIATQIQSQDSNILGNLVNSLGAPSQAGFLNSGSGMLSSLLGSSGSGLANALARFTGSEPADAQSVLGLVTPATFGALAQQDPQIWSSGQGIASLFEREKSAIVSAIPAGLAGALASTGLFSNLPGIADASSAAASTAQRAGETVESMRARASESFSDASASASASAKQANAEVAEKVDRASVAVEKAASGLPGWAKIAIPLVILGALVYIFMPSPAPTPAPAPAPTTVPAPTTAPRTGTAPSTATQAATELASFAQKTNSAVAGATASLAGITNVEQARAAQAKLQDSANELTAAGESFGRLPEAARRELAGPMQTALGGLREQLVRVMAIPGVGDVLKPTVDKILAAAGTFKA